MSRPAQRSGLAEFNRTVDARTDWQNVLGVPFRVTRSGRAMTDLVALPAGEPQGRWLVPRHLVVQVQDEGECDLRLDLEVGDDGLVQCRGLEVRGRPDGGPVTTSLLRSLPIDRLSRRAVSAAAVRAKPEHQGTRLSPLPVEQRAEAAATTRPPRGRPRGRTPEVEALARELAARDRVLRAAGEKQPVRVLRAELAEQEGGAAYARSYLNHLIRLGRTLEQQGETS